MRLHPTMRSLIVAFAFFAIALVACGGNPQPITYHWISPKNGELIKNTINTSVSLESGGVVRKLIFFVEESGRSAVQLCIAGENGTTWGCHGNIKDIQPRFNAGKVDVFFTAYNSQGQPVLNKSSSVQVKYIEPGGYWISPTKSPLHRFVHFAAQAFRTFPTDTQEPPVDHVNFTVFSQGRWQVACTVRPPSSGDVYSCTADFQGLGVVAGQVIVSFDVYEKGGFYNLSPNGEHMFQYQP